jgi:hypothetical protein
MTPRSSPATSVSAGSRPANTGQAGSIGSWSGFYAGNEGSRSIALAWTSVSSRSPCRRRLPGSPLPRCPWSDSAGITCGSSPWLRRRGLRRVQERSSATRQPAFVNFFFEQVSRVVAFAQVTALGPRATSWVGARTSSCLERPRGGEADPALERQGWGPGVLAVDQLSERRRYRSDGHNFVVLALYFDIPEEELVLPGG